MKEREREKYIEEEFTQWRLQTTTGVYFLFFEVGGPVFKNFLILKIQKQI